MTAFDFDSYISRVPGESFMIPLPNHMHVTGIALSLPIINIACISVVNCSGDPLFSFFGRGLRQSGNAVCVLLPFPLDTALDGPLSFCILSGGDRFACNYTILTQERPPHLLTAHSGPSPSPSPCPDAFTGVNELGSLSSPEDAGPAPSSFHAATTKTDDHHIESDLLVQARVETIRVVDENGDQRTRYYARVWDDDITRHMVFRDTTRAADWIAGQICLITQS